MKVLITGGAGFIGINTADYYSGMGDKIFIFDNLSRNGTNENLKWIKEKHRTIDFTQGDVRNVDNLKELFTEKGPFDLIIHLAAQVAVTTSVKEPREDFGINAQGTVNLLEAIRLYNPKTFLIYSSTNKVYGGMEDLGIVERDGYYIYDSLKDGVDEKRNLDFHSPYGCSKGSADQYCHDYSRIYGLDTVVMRQSCIYGYHQFGIEDQGWVAWFCIAAALGKNITIYGDGKQVRDVLFIDDLIDAFDGAFKKREVTRGKIYNIGGGPRNILSLHQLIHLLEKIKGKSIKISYSDWRPGDQRVYVSNIALAEKEFGFEPKIDPNEGVKRLYSWVEDNQKLFSY